MANKVELGVQFANACFIIKSILRGILSVLLALISKSLLNVSHTTFVGCYSYLPAIPTEIWCLILRYLDDDGLLLAVRSNLSCLEYAKGDSVLNKRLNSFLMKKREDFLKMKIKIRGLVWFNLPEQSIEAISQNNLKT
nr:unnamed protein product [Callosobruchus chinensis]